MRFEGRMIQSRLSLKGAMINFNLSTNTFKLCFLLKINFFEDHIIWLCCFIDDIHSCSPLANYIFLLLLILKLVIIFDLPIKAQI